MLLIHSHHVLSEEVVTLLAKMGQAMQFEDYGRVSELEDDLIAMGFVIPMKSLSDIYVSKLSEATKPFVVMEDELVHTDEHPFCDDHRCPCHDDMELFDALYTQFNSGFVTFAEMERIFAGTQL